MLLTRRALTVAAVLFVLVSIVGLLKTRLAPAEWLTLGFDPGSDVVPLAITQHIVLFQFKEGTSSTTIKQITSQMLSLKKTCKHPSTNQPYIKSITGGIDTSIENAQHGITHAFIVQFYSPEDRTYYVTQDPAHALFKTSAAKVLETVIVVDFLEGVFTRSPLSGLEEKEKGGAAGDVHQAEVVDVDGDAQEEYVPERFDVETN
ncbi:hypothetical protein K491DRAFT_691640 [Lophiostoma macrostomum CBS 122681]|uniref:Stress-response A/B barrel domain-containing protein n=1 Tax=Lophiostoma macrostomum CBS 122681 TaxID=1314788 RepID=A0A6A6TAF0_9PLEO|nr:hypothetical protein K491DRAFT_691640 [Lophiostoma macrostomum CBS 122681]